MARWLLCTLDDKLAIPEASDGVGQSGAGHPTITPAVNQRRARGDNGVGIGRGASGSNRAMFQASSGCGEFVSSILHAGRVRFWFTCSSALP